MASVLGIGVAVMTRICGGLMFLVQSLALCLTPNRCCSSTMTSPRLWNCTGSSMSACVPTSILISPLSSCWCSSVLCFLVVEPVRSCILTDLSLMNCCRVSRCWLASISVGAMIQVWKWLSAAMSAARSATSVLPEPTSPCRSRFICFPDLRSA